MFRMHVCELRADDDDDVCAAKAWQRLTSSM